MPNSITWASLHKSEAKKERKEKRIALLELVVKAFMSFAVGFFIGRFVEAISRGNI